MNIFNRLFLLLIAFFFSLSANSSSITYYTLSPPWDANARSSTELDACKTYNPNPNATYRITSGNFCQRTIWGSESFIGYAVANNVNCPFGNTGLNCNASCDLPKTMVNGQCVTPAPDPCATKAGSSLPFTKSGSSGDGYGTISGGFVAAAQSACSGGCAMSTVDQKCTGRVSGLYTCRGTGYFTGQKCSTTGAGSGIQENTSQQPLPTPQTIDDEKPCVYSQSGSKQVCQSSKSKEKEGQYCGTVNGVKKCVDSKPTKNGITIDTTVDTVTNPDGSKVTTKTDTATKTVCTGANQCTTTSTTTTTTTNTNANGDTTSVTGSCTGESCPDENTNPDGDGDGFGDCTGDDCGGGEGGSLNIGELPEFGDGTPTYGETMSAFVDKVQTIGFIAAARNISIPNGGGSCSVQPINIFGSSVSVDSFCETVPLILQPLSYLFLALWGWIAIRIILSA